MPRGQMSVEIAFAAIKWVFDAYEGAKTIQFFGGEPLYNPRLIIEVCEYLRVLVDNRRISRLPRLGMVTNGTLGDARIIQMLKRYDIGVTISIDGPEYVHDALRGKGTFLLADRFARQATRFTGARGPVGHEAADGFALGPYPAATHAGEQAGGTGGDEPG